MKNTLFICLFAMFALSGCVDDEEEFVTGGNIWGIERSGFFNGREKWAKGFENQRV